MGLEEYGFKDVSLMEGEHVDSALRLGDGRGAADTEVMLLTDRRVIHLQGNGRHQKAVFASIQEIEAVEITQEREGKGTFIWAALAFVVAVFLYFIIDHPIVRVIAAVVLALMGVYLIADQLMFPGSPLVIFKTGSSQLRCPLRGNHASDEVYPLINRLFQLKEENSSDPFARADRFAPR